MAPPDASADSGPRLAVAEAHLEQLSVREAVTWTVITYILTLLSSPALAKIPGLVGCHATALTVPG